MVPSIFLPKFAARIWLEITDIRVEKLQNISETDAMAEGAENALWGSDGKAGAYKDLLPISTYKAGYSILWDHINGKTHPWASEPWVWVISFKRISHETSLSQN
jgi:hypothetical protein